MRYVFIKKICTIGFFFSSFFLKTTICILLYILCDFILVKKFIIFYKIFNALNTEYVP